ncbi:MAG TPA: hypothetical protein VNN79_01105 [Actinomycetota bacterium]|nr:hypothetical protein [Actinomycetota bacterium]
MPDKHLVLSFFADEPAAMAAATNLKDSGEIEGDAIGILVLDKHGNLDVDKVGARSWAAGAGVGACLVVLGPAVLGVGLLGGTLGGGLHHKGLKLNTQDASMIRSQLRGGKAAVGVLAKTNEVSAVKAALTDLGGDTSGHEVVDEDALQKAAAEPVA